MTVSDKMIEVTLKTLKDAVNDGVSSIQADWMVKQDEFDEITEKEYNLVEKALEEAKGEVFDYIKDYISR